MTVLIDELEQGGPVKFFYRPEWLAHTTIEQDYNGKTLEYFLEDIFRGTDMEFQVVGNYAIILIKDPSQSILRDRLLTTATRERKKIEALTIGSPAGAPKGR